MVGRSSCALSAVVLGMFFIPGTSSAQTVINFETTAQGDPTTRGQDIANAYASLGVSFYDQTTAGTLYDAVTAGSAFASYYGGSSAAIVNAPGGNYLTTNYLDVFFKAPATGISFYFNNFGANETSFYTAYNAGGVAIGSGLLGTENGSNLVTLGALAGVSLIKFSNGDGTDVFSDGGSIWEFSLTDLAFNETQSGIPEPASMAIFSLSLCAVALGRHRRIAARDFGRVIFRA